MNTGLLSKPLRLGGIFPATSIIRREIRAALGAGVSLLVLEVCLPLIPCLTESISRSAWHAEGIYDRWLPMSWNISVVLWALILGTLCGAEEEERGTLDFPFRLPISRLRLLSEKLAAAVLLFVIWCMATILADMLAVQLFCGGTDTILAGEDIWPLRQLLMSSLLFFSFGLAVGAWTKNVIGSVIVAGIVGSVVLNLARFTVYRAFNRVDDNPATWALLAVPCIVALAVAALRYHTRAAR